MYLIYAVDCDKKLNTSQVKVNDKKEVSAEGAGLDDEADKRFIVFNTRCLFVCLFFNSSGKRYFNKESVILADSFLFNPTKPKSTSLPNNLPMLRVLSKQGLEPVTSTLSSSSLWATGFHGIKTSKHIIMFNLTLQSCEECM